MSVKDTLFYELDSLAEVNSVVDSAFDTGELSVTSGVGRVVDALSTLNTKYLDLSVTQ